MKCKKCGREMSKVCSICKCWAVHCKNKNHKKRHYDCGVCIQE